MTLRSRDAETLIAMAAKAVMRHAERLSEALDELPAPIYVTDPHGVITHFNQACIALAGRTPVVRHDKWCVTWKLYTIEGEALPHDRCPMAIAIQRECPMRGEEAVAERPDGTRIRFVPYPTPIFDSVGEMIGAVNLLMDVTEQRRAQALRAEAARCRRLAYAISHAETVMTLKAMAAEFDEQAEQISRPH